MRILILLSAAKKVRHILKLQFPVAYLKGSIALAGFLKNDKMTFYLLPYYPLTETSCISNIVTFTAIILFFLDFVHCLVFN